jgi:hypothetical protein
MFLTYHIGQAKGFEPIPTVPQTVMLPLHHAHQVDVPGGSRTLGHLGESQVSLSTRPQEQEMMIFTHHL